MFNSHGFSPQIFLATSSSVLEILPRSLPRTIALPQLSCSSRIYCCPQSSWPNRTGLAEFACCLCARIFFDCLCVGLVPHGRACQSIGGIASAPLSAARCRLGSQAPLRRDSDGQQVTSFPSPFERATASIAYTLQARRWWISRDERTHSIRRRIDRR